MDIAAAVPGDITCILSVLLHVARLAGNTAYIQARYHTHILLPWDAGNVGTKALDVDLILKCHMVLESLPTLQLIQQRG